MSHPKHPFRMNLLLAAAGVTLATASGLAQATDFYFDIVNNTTQSIVQAWVSPVASDDWGKSFRNVFVPHSGGRQRMEFSYGNAYSTTCRFDVRVQFSGGQANYWNNVDLCRTNGLEVDVSGGKVMATAF